MKLAVEFQSGREVVLEVESHKDFWIQASSYRRPDCWLVVTRYKGSSPEFDPDFDTVMYFPADTIARLVSADTHALVSGTYEFI